MRTLTEAIDYIDTNYPQEFIVHNRFLSTDIFMSGPMPKYLFRGESQLWPKTQSTASRKGIQNDPDFTEINYWITGRHPKIGAVLNRHCLYNFLRESLYGISITEDHYDNPDMDKAIAALLQHYGFDTALVDFTSDLRVAAFFASFNSPVGSAGRIFVLPTRGIERFVFDLSLDKASRPRKQKAFALVLPKEYDLKDSNCRFSR